MFRPRFQFRLATLLIVVTLVATVLAWQIRRRAVQRILAARLQALQAYDDELRAAYRKTAALMVAQAIGGELSRFYRDGAELFLADADLAFERGDRATGVGLLKKSFCCACDCLDAIPDEPHRRIRETADDSRSRGPSARHRAATA